MLNLKTQFMSILVPIKLLGKTGWMLTQADWEIRHPGTRAFIVKKPFRCLDRQLSVKEVTLIAIRLSLTNNTRILVVSGNNRRLEVPSIGWLIEKECIIRLLYDSQLLRRYSLLKLTLYLRFLEHWVLIPQNFLHFPKYKPQNNKLTGINLQFRLHCIFEIKVHTQCESQVLCLTQH